jgi:muramoyltetrapeptide carboxypeptidase
MDRKSFLSALGILSTGTALNGLAAVTSETAKRFIIPPYLKTGDTIGITSPAGYISLEAIQPAKLLMERWGFKVKVGATIGRRSFTFGGTDVERTADLQEMIDDPSLGAIMCGRGGYGFVRIIDDLDFSGLRKNPKWIIGFSDVTVFHSHLNRRVGMASLHSKMCNSFPDVWESAEPIQVDTILSIRAALTGEQMNYEVPYQKFNRMGTAKGQLVGGNLSILETLSGTPSAMLMKGKILFLEDTGEYLYSIDRMLWNLKRSGMLSGLSGLVIGNFKVKADDPEEEFGRTVYEIVLEKVNDYSFPICFDFPVGHQRNNFAIKSGVMHELAVSGAGTRLKSLA